MRYIQFLYLLLVINATNSMEHTNQKQTYLPELPLEIWSKIFYYVPITDRFKQLMLAHNNIALSKKHVQLLAHQWYSITQNHLKKIPDDGSNDINMVQKDYLQNALSWTNSLNTQNKELFSVAIDTVLRQQTNNCTFKQLKNYFVSSRGNISLGYQIKRISIDIPLSLEQRKLFLIAFNYSNAATINALNHEFPLEQVNGMGTFGNGLLPFQALHEYFEQQTSKEKYHYQKIGNFNPFCNQDKKPLSAITNSVSLNHNDEQKNQLLVVNLQIKVSSLE